MIKKLIGLIVFVALIAGGVVAYRSLSGQAFGISPEQPLGNLEKIEKYLIQGGLEKSESKLNVLTAKALNRKFLQYIDPATGDPKKGYEDRVLIVTSRDGRIREVKSRFRPRPEGAKTPPKSRVGLTSWAFWLATGGRGATFSPGKASMLSLKSDAQVAEFTQGTVRGRWIWTQSYEEVRLRIE